MVTNFNLKLANLTLDWFCKDEATLADPLCLAEVTYPHIISPALVRENIQCTQSAVSPFRM
jgi:hypothetical protein